MLLLLRRHSVPRLSDMVKVLLALAFALLALPACGEKEADKVEGSTKDIKWGHHWAGPELKVPADLEGKVTLLVIWGG